MNLYEKIESSANSAISLDYESFIINFFSTSEGNLIISLANDDIAKNNDEEIFNFFMKNSDLPWGANIVKLFSPDLPNKKENSKK